MDYMDKDRQMYQMQKKGFDDLKKSIDGLEFKLEIEVNGATVKNVELTEEEDEEEGS